jgi:hypothetical protein
MLRTFALPVLLALAAIAACGGDDDSNSPTPTASPAATSAAATTLPAGAPTAAASDGPTPVPTLPANAVTWTFGAPISGDVPVGLSFPCNVAPGSFQVQLSGVFNDNPVTVLFGGNKTGTLDFSDSNSSLAVNVQYGAASSSVDYSWYGIAGTDGTSGVVTIDANGNGSMGVVVPPSNDPSAATSGIAVTGAWNCSS